MATSIVSSRKNALPHHELMESLSPIDDSQFHGVVCPESRSQLMIGEALKSRIEAVDANSCLPGEEDPFFVCDLAVIERNYATWTTYLSRVEPFYAVKCNGDPVVLKLMASWGIGFDCASYHEIRTMLDLGVAPSQIIFANPCKTASYIRYAKAVQVAKMTFDNLDELQKIARFYPSAECLLRIATDDSAAQCQLSSKFGAPPADSRSLLTHAHSLGLNVTGVAFHVGSGSSDPLAFVDAISRARTVFDEAEALGMTPMTLLDVGGGFSESTFVETATRLNEALEVYFSGAAFKDLRIIAEPGRFLVANAFTLAASVIAKRSNIRLGDATAAMLYVNDGVYGNLNSIIFDHQDPEPSPLIHSGVFLYGTQSSGNYKYSLWGPTCDGLDCITKNVEFSIAVNVGDWIAFKNMGAYTLAASTTFNGFNCVCDVLYVRSSNE